MELGNLLIELETEFNHTDFDISATHIISGLITNVFKEYETVTTEILIKEIQIRLDNLREYNLQRKEEEAA